MKEVTRTVLIADAGMVLTNGDKYCREVYLKVGGDASPWHEITEEEYAATILVNEEIEAV